MRNWIIPHAAMQQVDVLLFDAFSNHCLANTIEPLRAANTLAGRGLYRWRILSTEDGPVASSSGLRLTPDARLDGAGGDLLIVMPSYRHRDHARPGVLRGLRAAAGRYGVLAGFDTGSWLLAEAGLLEGRAATIHWDLLDSFAERFPGIRVTRARHVTCGDRVTCSGAMAAFDLVLDMIGQRHGQALRLEVASMFMSPEATGSDAPEGPGVRTRSVARALALMQANIETPLPVAALARAVGRSQRDLAVRMRAELGTTPQAVYRRLRLAQARRLVIDSDLGVAEIALRCGYLDAAAMTRAFRAEFGTTPQALRRPGGQLA